MVHEQHFAISVTIGNREQHRHSVRERGCTLSFGQIECLGDDRDFNRRHLPTTNSETSKFFNTDLS